MEPYIKAKKEAIDEQEIEDEVEEEDEEEEEEEIEDLESYEKYKKQERKPPPNYRIITTIRHPKVKIHLI